MHIDAVDLEVVKASLVRHRAGDAELAVPHRLLHHRARVAGRLLRADERQGRGGGAARGAAAAYRRISRLLPPPSSTRFATVSRRATPSSSTIPITAAARTRRTLRDHAGLRRATRCSASAARSRTRATSAVPCREAAPARRARPSMKACTCRPCATSAAIGPSPISSASSAPTAARPNWCSATSAGSSVPTGWASGALNELVGKFGKDKILACFDRLLEMSEAKLKAAIAEWADGRFEAERFVDDDGVDLEQPVRIHVVVDKTGRPAAFRFHRLGRPDQRAGQYPPAAGAGGLRLCADLADRPEHVRVERAAARLRHDGARRQRAQPALPRAGEHLQSDHPCAGRRHLRRA